MINHENKNKFDILKKIQNSEGKWELTVCLHAIERFDWSDKDHKRMHDLQIRHSHRSSHNIQPMLFDSDPSDQDIIEMAEEYGHSFEITESMQGQTRAWESVYDIGPIVAETLGEEDAVHYSPLLHPREYLETLDLIKDVITLEEPHPSSVTKKGDWLNMYWTTLQKPTQFFEDDHFCYSVRVHITTGETKRKIYHMGNPLGLPEFDKKLNGITPLAVGIYLDESNPRYTVYYPKSIEAKDQVEDVAIVDTPYLGTTFEDGIEIRTREYKHKDV